jgi:predicted DNA-binding transcriptional regulator AlpA
MPAAKQTPSLIDKHRPRRSVNRPVPSVTDDGAVYSVIDQIKQHRGPMSVPQLAPILGVSDHVLYAMVRNGDIPQLIVPGRTLIRFDPASIVFWLCKHNPLLKQVQKAS